jgi:hypothetical protein
MNRPEEIARLRAKMIEHLEAALALADEKRRCGDRIHDRVRS